MVLARGLKNLQRKSHSGEKIGSGMYRTDKEICPERGEKEKKNKQTRKPARATF